MYAGTRLIRAENSNMLEFPFRRVPGYTKMVNTLKKNKKIRRVSVRMAPQKPAKIRTNAWFHAYMRQLWTQLKPVASSVNRAETFPSSVVCMPHSSTLTDLAAASDRCWVNSVTRSSVQSACRFPTYTTAFLVWWGSLDTSFHDSSAIGTNDVFWGLTGDAQQSENFPIRLPHSRSHDHCQCHPRVRVWKLYGVLLLLNHVYQGTWYMVTWSLRVRVRLRDPFRLVVLWGCCSAGGEVTLAVAMADSFMATTSSFSLIICMTSSSIRFWDGPPGLQIPTRALTASWPFQRRTIQFQGLSSKVLFLIPSGCEWQFWAA